MAASVSQVLEAERREFEARTQGSLERFQRAVQVFPGGDTRAVTFYPPYPAAIRQAQGIELVDLDGNRYLDFLLNYTTMIAGHVHPEVSGAALAAIARGSAVAAPVCGQVELAEELTRRVASVERLRFVNSGTEATMAAVRLARAFTGRPLIVKAIGGYHGSYPELEMELRPGVLPAGIPDSVQVVSIPFNDPGALCHVMDQRAEHCAAVILEPVLGAAGVIPPEAGYLASAEKVTKQAGALLILDEVITFRLGRGGFQGHVGVTPDLTTFGKVIGGGFPVGAVGGRTEVMDLYAPGASPGVKHSGTFNGNGATVAAGRKTLDLLDDAAYERLDGLGERLARGLTEALNMVDRGAQVTHAGSLVNVHFVDHPVSDADAALAADQEMAAAFHLGLLNRGVFIAPRGLFALSLVTSEADVDLAVAAASDVLNRFE